MVTASRALTVVALSWCVAAGARRGFARGRGVCLGSRAHLGATLLSLEIQEMNYVSRNRKDQSAGGLVLLLEDSACLEVDTY